MLRPLLCPMLPLSLTWSSLLASPAVAPLPPQGVEASATWISDFFRTRLNQKSIWYKFTLPTSRSVRVNLSQPGVAIGASDAGFAIYKISSCLPGNADISTKLTPHEGFDSTFHPCVDPGDYLIQVCAKNIANGPVYIKITLGGTTAMYDHPAQAYNFGTLSVGVKSVDYAVRMSFY